MAKATLLEMVQDTLSSMDSDEVNSISDTVESLQVAQAFKTTFEELFSNVDMPEFHFLTKLDALGDVQRPNYLKVPEGVKEIFWIKYDAQTDGQTDYQVVTYLSPEQFLEKTAQNRNQSSSIEVPELQSGIKLFIYNDRNPKFWTSFDDLHVVFDAYNQALDTTLKQSKSMAWAHRDPVFEIRDDFVPLLDANLFPLLLAETKAYCFINFKQVSNSKEEQKARRQHVRSMNDMWRLNQRKPYNQNINFGRRPI